MNKYNKVFLSRKGVECVDNSYSDSTSLNWVSCNETADCNGNIENEDSCTTKKNLYDLCEEAKTNKKIRFRIRIGKPRLRGLSSFDYKLKIKNASTNNFWKTEYSGNKSFTAVEGQDYYDTLFFEMAGSINNDATDIMIIYKIGTKWKQSNNLLTAYLAV